MTQEKPNNQFSNDTEKKPQNDPKITQMEMKRCIYTNVKFLIIVNHKVFIKFIRDITDLSSATNSGNDKNIKFYKDNSRQGSDLG